MCSICDEKNIPLHIYSEASEIADTLLRKKYADDPVFFFMDWIILEEEKLQLTIEKWLSDQKKEVLSRFNDFESELTAKSFDLLPLTKAMNMFPFNPKIAYTQIGNFRFERHTFPTELKDISKSGNPAAEHIEIISHINTNPFVDALNNSSLRSSTRGGQAAFASIGIQLQFNMRDKIIENALKNANIQLSDQVKQQLQSKIRFELYDGVRNGESLKQLRDRVLTVFDKPITVTVPPKIKNGEIVRAGYSYQMAPKDWAAAVAGNEVSKGFMEGKLEGYRQMGVVEQVQFVVTPDERLCEICEPYSDQIFKLDEAGGLIPLHPRCRCTMVPYFSDMKMDDVRNNALQNIQYYYAVRETLPKLEDEIKLETGNIKSIEELPGGVNGVYKTENGIKGVLKYKDEEHPFQLRDGIEEKTQYLREVAASKVDRVYEFDIVPTTVLRKYDDKIASHQLYLDGFKTWSKAPEAWREKVAIADREKFGLFDYIVGNEDRHTGNFMINNKGTIYAIDNGLTLGRFVKVTDKNFWSKAWDLNESIKDKGHFAPLWDALMNENNVKLLKKEIFDSGLIDTESFNSLLSRIRHLIKTDGVLLSDSNYHYTLMNTSTYYNSKKFSADKSVKDLIKLIKSKK